MSILVDKRHRRLGRGCYKTRLDEQGRCPKCGRKTYFNELAGKWLCHQRRQNTLWKLRHKSQKVRFGDEAREWLGEKIGLQADDPRIDIVAYELAKADKLVALFSINGALIAVAKPKQP